MGSEDELVARYGVSRPTMRQAASLVVQEQLLTVRRGMGGGYFSRAPNAHAVGRMAALYLRYHGASPAEILAAFMPLRMELARLAVDNDDKVLREEFREFIEYEEGIKKYSSFREFVVRERSFNLLLARIGGNQALGLFMEILLDLAAMIDSRDDMYRNKPDRVEDLRRERNALARAILDRDNDFAVAIARRCSRMSYQWHQEDLSKHGKGKNAEIILLSEHSAA
jgi:GntR family transcriptional regulator, transcriptional repressor for pyruvate dehydrogenase complex